MTPEQLEAVLKNSPLVLIVLIVLWQYRRDYTKIFKDSGSTTSQLISLFERVIVALNENKVETRENRLATQENTEVIKSLIHPNNGQRIQRK